MEWQCDRGRDVRRMGVTVLQEVAEGLGRQHGSYIPGRRLGRAFSAMSGFRVTVDVGPAMAMAAE